MIAIAGWVPFRLMKSARISDCFCLCVFVVACCSAVNFVESRQVERRSGVEEMIAGLRSKAQHSHASVSHSSIRGATSEGGLGSSKGRAPQRINFQSEDPQQRRRRGLPPVLPPADGDVNGKNFDGPFPRPLTERNAGSPCKMKGLIVRREMGNTGVTAFQVCHLASFFIPTVLTDRSSSALRVTTMPNKCFVITHYV